MRAVGDWENDRRKPRNRLGALEEILGVRLDAEPEPFTIPASLLATIRRTLPPEEQELAIAALEEALSPSAHSEDAPSGQSGSSRRAGLPQRVSV